MSIKKYYSVNRNKNTHENIIEYFKVLDLLRSIPFQRIKFMDESHFVSSAMNTKNIYFPRGYAPLVCVDKSLNLRFTITLLTSLTSGMPIIHYQATSTGNSRTYYSFMKNLAQDDIFQKDDVIVMDNASLPHSNEHKRRIKQLEYDYGFTIVYLPTYSPELNPCELVFGLIKGQLKKQLNVFENEFSFVNSLAMAIESIDPVTIINYYDHCINEPFNNRNRIFKKDVINLVGHTYCEEIAENFYSMSNVLKHEIENWLNDVDSNENESKYIYFDNIDPDNKIIIDDHHLVDDSAFEQMMDAIEEIYIGSL